MGTQYVALDPKAITLTRQDEKNWKATVNANKDKVGGRHLSTSIDRSGAGDDRFFPLPLRACPDHFAAVDRGAVRIGWLELELRSLAGRFGDLPIAACM